MVCLGNICRSPLAQGILESKIDPTRIFVDSAGTGGYHVGKAPDFRSIQVAREHGLEIAQQRCRKFDITDFKDFDRIFVMDRNNYRSLAQRATSERDMKKVSLILGGRKEVPDPYHGSASDFEMVYEMLDEACTALAEDLEKAPTA